MFTSFHSFMHAMLTTPSFFSSVPSKVKLVNVTERSVTSITLEWNVEAAKGWTYSVQFNGKESIVQPEGSSHVLSHSLTSLQPGTEYPFSVTTVFCGLNSAAHEDVTVTGMLRTDQFIY